jgi:signal transduction histidine kinase
MAVRRAKRSFRFLKPLKGWWLSAARIGWFVLALLALITCIGGLIYIYQSYSYPCEPVRRAECDFVSLRHMSPSAREGLALYTVTAVLFMVTPWTVFGWLIVLRGSNQVGLLVMALGLATGWANDLSGENLTYAFFNFASSQAGFMPLGYIVIYLVRLTSIMSILIAALLLPDGKLRPRWSIWVILVWFIYTAFSIFYHYPFEWFQDSLSLELLDRFFAVTTPLTLIILIWLKYRFYVTGSGKIQLRSLLPSTLASTAVYTLFAAWTVYIWFDNTPEMTPLRFTSHFVQVGVQSVFYAWFGISIGIAILRYNLFSADLIVSRTLIYSSLSGLLLLIYLSIIFGIGSLLGINRAPWLSLLATALTIVLFQPLRALLAEKVNRSLYGTREVPFQAFVEFSQELQNKFVPKDYFPSIVQTISRRFGLPYVRLVVETNSINTSLSAGSIHGKPKRFLIADDNKTLGWFEVCVTPGEVLTQEEKKVLETVAGQLGVSISSFELNAELQAVRQRLVVTREEERRRLQRDLHDRLGPTLAAQTLVVSSARQLMASDPAQADVLLMRLEDDLCKTLEDVRRLVYSLTPNDLHQLGLLDALRLKLDALAGDDLALELAFPAPPCSYPAAVESAAYHIITEAVTNVVRHARARCCHVELGAHGDRLELSVTDDGLGLTVVRQGIGLLSMRERAEELGGHFSVSSPQGGKGVRVWASLPLHEVQAVLEAAR